MIASLVALALRFRALVIGLAIVLVLGGMQAYGQLDVEAYPNPVPPVIDVITQPHGQGAEEVERYVTVPIELELTGIPGLEHIRSQSIFGLSDIKCYFRWGTSYGDARQEVLNRLQSVQLPSGLSPQIAAVNAVGEVMRYTVRGKDWSTRDLKAAEDWVLEPELRRARGVVDVVGFGGETKQYHIEIDPFRLRSHDASVADVIGAVQNANKNVGGQHLVLGEQAYAVRGIGLLRNARDVEDIVVSEQRGVPVRVRDVADVSIGGAPRLGQVGMDEDDDVVQGNVIMAYGDRTTPTLEAIHDRVDKIRKRNVLPPGMQIVPYYDRGELVKVTTHTVAENVTLGITLVTLVLFLFLGHARAALVAAINIPLAVLVAICGMVLTSTSANLISFGAIDFGIVVDSTVIMMEAAARHVGAQDGRTRAEKIVAGAREVGGPMLFSTLVIGAAFFPLFTLNGVAGVIFSPMAVTYALAIGGATLLALTLTPVLSSFLLPDRADDTPSRLMRIFSVVYGRVFRITVRRPRTMLAIALVPVLLGLAAFPELGQEFMPKLEEGNLWIRVQLPGSISPTQAGPYVSRMRAIVRKHPEVAHVVSQLGRPDSGTDVAGWSNVELFAPLVPHDRWSKGRTKEALVEELARELDDAFPGAAVNFSQMIRDNVEEALSGVKGENSIKVFGPDMRANDATARAITEELASVPGIRDVGMFRSFGQPTVKIEPDRLACARYGLNTGDVEAVVQAAVGGQSVTQIYEGEKRFDLTVRWLDAYRSSLEALREITVPTKDHANVPLGQLATIEVGDGASVIYREDGQRFTAVKFSVRGRDLGGAIAEAQAKVDGAVKLSWDSHLEWDGEADELRHTLERLRFVVPTALVLVATLVYLAMRRGIDCLVVFLNVPVALAGGIVALIVTRTSFSVSAAMGFVSVLGIAVQDAILVVSHYRKERERGSLAVIAAESAASTWLRPCLMTTMIAMIGLLPVALSTGIGAETQKPLAIVVIGGCLMIAIVARFLQPAALLVFDRSNCAAPTTPSAG